MQHPLQSIVKSWREFFVKGDVSLEVNRRGDSNFDHEEKWKEKRQGAMRWMILGNGSVRSCKRSVGTSAHELEHLKEVRA